MQRLCLCSLLYPAPALLLGEEELLYHTLCRPLQGWAVSLTLLLKMTCGSLTPVLVLVLVPMIQCEEVPKCCAA